MMLGEGAVFSTVILFNFRITHTKLKLFIKNLLPIEQMP